MALVATAFSTTRGSLAASALLYGLGFGGAYPAFVTWVLGRTVPERRAATFGSILLAFDAGVGLGSMATGLVVTRLGFTAAFAGGAAVALLAIPLFLAGGRLLRNREV